MDEFIRAFLGYIGDFWNLLNSFTFQVFGINVSWGAIIFASLVIGFVVSVFWKGAQT